MTENIIFEPGEYYVGDFIPFLESDDKNNFIKLKALNKSYKTNYSTFVLNQSFEADYDKLTEWYSKIESEVEEGGAVSNSIHKVPDEIRPKFKDSAWFFDMYNHEGTLYDQFGNGYAYNFGLFGVLKFKYIEKNCSDLTHKVIFKNSFTPVVKDNILQIGHLTFTI